MRSALEGLMVEDATAPAAPDVLVDYFRCPPSLCEVTALDGLSSDAGYFTFDGIVGYGQSVIENPPRRMARGQELRDAAGAVVVEPGVVRLPFDLSAIVTNLREERYTLEADTRLDQLAGTRMAREFYYRLRPGLPLFARKAVQKARFSGWQRIPFPRWPVDSSVDDLMQRSLALVLRATGIERLPFIWFWPEGAPACAIVTHDVEGPDGYRFCEALMDLDDAFGVKAAFQVIPEPRERFDRAVVERLRQRQFEVNVHDLNHDGYLFEERGPFLERAERINGYARELQAEGFRAGAMYRRQEWFDAFDFAYDMSVPNVAHLEPQRGGCCTVMPYFVGGLLELPLTTVQDYSLFHILNDYSTDLWDRQIDRIASLNGLITILTHPDYLGEARAREIYRRLLARLARLREQKRLWLTIPGAVNRWWRNRAAMRLVRAGTGWRVEGADSSRARVAYASLNGERLVYSVEAGR